MTHGVQMVAVATPHPSLVHEEEYKKGERILPKRDGQYTFFLGTGKVFTKDDQPDADKDELTPGLPAAYDCYVTWIAFGDTAKQVAERAQARSQIQTPKLLAAK